MPRPAGRLFGAYVGLAIAGAVLPYLIFIPWAADYGPRPGLFLRQLFVNRPATIFATDVLYAAAIFMLFVLVEGRRLGGSAPLAATRARRYSGPLLRDARLPCNARAGAGLAKCVSQS